MEKPYEKATAIVEALESWLTKRELRIRLEQASGANSRATAAKIMETADRQHYIVVLADWLNGNLDKIEPENTNRRLAIVTHLARKMSELGFYNYAACEELLYQAFNAGAEVRNKELAQHTAAEGVMPSCHVCGATLRGFCVKCGATTEVVAQDPEQILPSRY